MKIMETPEFKVIADSETEERKFVSFFDAYEEAEKFAKSLFKHRKLFSDKILTITLYCGPEKWQHWNA